MKLPRRPPWKGWIAPLMFIPSAAAAQADPGPICTDRPGKATGTCTVAPGHLQFETALADWSLQKTGGARQTLLTIGETEFKLGLTERSELAVDFAPFVRPKQRAGSARERQSGFGDTTLLYKHRITASGAPVQVAVLPTVKLPTARRDIGNGKVEAGLLLPISYDIPKSQFSIGLTPEVDLLADGDGDGHHAAMAQVASLSWAATDRLSFAAEIWGQWDWDPDGTEKQASLDATAAYLITDDLEVDSGVNMGLTRDTPDVELYAGVSVRF